MATATAVKSVATATGHRTAETNRRRLPDGSINWSASGELPNPVEREPGVKPLKAINLIIHGDSETIQPAQIFVPISAEERRELLSGTFPAAEEPSEAELSLFGRETEFG